MAFFCLLLLDFQFLIQGLVHSDNGKKQLLMSYRKEIAHLPPPSLSFKKWSVLLIFPCFACEIESHCVGQVGHKFTSTLPPLSECWDCRHAPPHSDLINFSIQELSFVKNIAAFFLKFSCLCIIYPEQCIL